MFEMKNGMFWTIWIGTIAMQIGIVEFGGKVFSTVPLNWKLWAVSFLLAASSVPLSILVKLLKGSQVSLSAALHPTREELAWQSAIHNVTTRARFYSAIRRKLASSGVDLNMKRAAETRNDVVEMGSEKDPFETPDMSPKSTDSLLLD